MGVYVHYFGLCRAITFGAADGCWPQVRLALVDYCGYLMPISSVWNPTLGEPALGGLGIDVELHGDVVRRHAGGA